MNLGDDLRMGIGKGYEAIAMTRKDPVTIGYLQAQYVLWANLIPHAINMELNKDGMQRMPIRVLNKHWVNDSFHGH